MINSHFPAGSSARRGEGCQRTIASIERGRWTGEAVKRSGTPVSKRKCLQKSKVRDRKRGRGSKKAEFARDADSAEHDVDAVNDDDDDDDHGWPHFVPF